MRRLLFLGAFSSAVLILGFAGNPVPPDLPLINRLDEQVQRRFEDPLPKTLGMTRVVGPPSFGEHFRPKLITQRDFTPENEAEKQLLAALEEKHAQVGFYLFGASIIHADASLYDYRALKGPAAITAGTPRPAWYPPFAKPDAAAADTLPDWSAIYPLARKAMMSFQDGGRGFETRMGSWHIAARPVIAASDRCVTCHNHQPGTAFVAKLNQPVGGVLYAFRRSGGSDSGSK